MNNKSYDADYKLKLLELIENGQNIGDIAQEYGVPVKTIHQWMDVMRRERKNVSSYNRRNPEYQEHGDFRRLAGNR